MKRGIQYIVLDIVLALVFLSFLFLSGISPAVEIKGSITADSVWTADMSPYIVTGDILIARDVTLKIEQGVIVSFSDSEVYHIEVRGTLVARGSDNNPVLFTTENKDHYWGYIEFTEDSTAWDEARASGCILSHCIIEYGGNADNDADGGAAIRSVLASPLIRDCIIRYSKADGIYTISGVQNIVDNRIHDTACGIKLIMPERGYVENNYLINNGQGLYIESGANNIVIKNNTVRSSSSEIFGGCLGINLLYHDNLASYLWEQVAGPEAIPSNPNDVEASSNPDNVNFSFTAPYVSKDELMTFQLTVTDKAGLLSVDTVNVGVKGDNMPPVADAGPDQTLAEGIQAVLDGSNSIDPDGSSLIYEWEQTSGPEVVLSDAFSVHCTFTTPTGVSQYGEMSVFQLTVKDNGDLLSRDTVNILVMGDDRNEAPVAYAGPGQTVTEGDSVVLDGSRSTDPENAIISLLWDQVEGQNVDITGATLQKAGFTAPETEREGKCLIFMLTVTDDAFQESSDKVIVNVIDSNPNDRHLPLSADAGSDQEVNEGTYVSLNGSATDPNGLSYNDTGTSYDWESISGPSVTLSGTGANRSFTAPDVTEDTEMVFRLTVTDEYGLKSADRITVMVRWINEGPEADAGPDHETEEGYKVLLDGSASKDRDDGIASYMWEQISGPEVVLSSDKVVKPVFTAPEISLNERLVFRLTVTDRSGDRDQDLVSINVTPENKPPVADAGQDMVVVWRTEVTLDGSGSYDPEDPNNGIVSYLWEEKDKTTVTLYDATTVHPRFIAPQRAEDGSTPDFQSLTFILTVKDKNDMESTDSVVVNITDYIGANQMPVSNAGPDQSAAAGHTVILDGSGSRDPDVLSKVNVSNNHFINNDNEGAGNAIAIKKGQSANCHLSIRSNNLENLYGNFMVYLYNWADKDSGFVDMTDNWWGTASADDIDLMIYDHDNDEYVPQVNYDQVKGAEITGAGSDLSYPPIADAGDDQSVKPDDIVTLDGLKEYDPDDIMSYEWIQTEGQTVAIRNAGSAVAYFIAPSPEEKDDEGEEAGEEEGVLEFKLTVTDSEGFYDTDEVIVTIMASEEETKRETSSGCFISLTIPELNKQPLIRTYKKIR